jgi:UDP-N-acetylmuramyl pentapeptide phosphotransferase/UDP-N-acetylglucosamine-1-phosphate transferase
VSFSVSLIIAALVSFVAALVLARRLCAPGSRLLILDHPNERSLHSRPTPRTGGVAIVAGVVTGVLILLLVFKVNIPEPAGWLFGLGLAIAMVSFFDDRRHLPAIYRITTHIVAAGLVVYGGLVIKVIKLPGIEFAMAGWLAGIITVLFIVWMTNLYNFMDGMDGFAGGMALIGFGALALFGLLAGNDVFAALNLVVACAAAGFLVFNFPPAKIFMGDTGSSTLGFLAAGMSLWGESAGILPLWISALVFSPFIVDASVTLIRRLLKRERVWLAHKSHYYQRLVQMGWGHRKTVLAEYALMAACAVSAVIAVRATPAIQWGIIVFWVLAYVSLMAWVDRRWSRIHARMK